MAEILYKAFPTALGKEKIAAAILHGEKVNFTHIAVGDGAGAYYAPTEDQTGLLNECWRGEISGYEISATDPNMISVRTVIPAGAATFTAREALLIDSDGDGVAIWNMPAAELPSADSGASFPLTVVADIIVEDASVVTVTVNPTLEPVSRTELTETLTRYARATHAETHAHNGTDPLTPADIKAADRAHTHGLPDVFGQGINTPADLAVLLGAARVQSGSYVGSGVSGTNSPNSITFDFVPKLVLVRSLVNLTGFGLFTPFAYSADYKTFGYHETTAMAYQYSPGTDEHHCARMEDLTMSWYCDNGPSSNDYSGAQLNTEGDTYYWIAIG